MSQFRTGIPNRNSWNTPFPNRLQLMLLSANERMRSRKNGLNINKRKGFAPKHQAKNRFSPLVLFVVFFCFTLFSVFFLRQLKQELNHFHIISYFCSELGIRYKSEIENKQANVVVNVLRRFFDFFFSVLILT